MSTNQQGRFSKFINPISRCIDIGLITGFIFLFPINFNDVYFFLLYSVIFWEAIAFYNHFYEVQRHTRLFQIVALLLRQFILLAFALYAYIGFFKQPNISRMALGEHLMTIFLLVSFFKILTFFLLSRYRAVLGGNLRNVIVLGNTEKARQLIKIFNTKLHFGYKFKKQFIVKDDEFSLKKCFDYIIENEINEIYFSVASLSNKQINKLIDFADNNLKELKFIPDNKDIYSRKLKYEYYDYIPILSLRDIPIQEPVNKFAKRAFDIVFSSCVIIFLLSWLTPILAIIIRLESKGPIFFKQSRNGFNYKEFDCYKFRSMTPNDGANEQQATKGDMRITKVGAFIRKTSIDELPQFFNVLFGDMSVVGPRPHMVKHTNLYAERIDKFMVRHFVKPGITGLAQTSGFRGEIETDKDIVNRVKYDIFYIENWSLLLDLKIVVQTFLNAVKGEEKAY